MKKKILLLVAMVAMLVCILSISISAAEPSYKDGEWIYADDDTTKLAIRDTDGNPLIWYMNGDELKWVRADQTDKTQDVYVEYSISAGGSGFDAKIFTPQKTLKKITIFDNGTEIAGSGSDLNAQKIVLLNLEKLDIDALNGWLWGNKNGCCPLMRGLVLPSTLKGIGTEGFTNHKVVQIWNLENTQLMYIATSFSAPFGSSSLTQEATNYTLKFPSTLTVLPIVQRSSVKTVIFSPNTSSQNTNRTLGDMPNIKKMFMPASMAEVGFNPETFRSTTNMLLFFTGTKEQAQQMQTNSSETYQGHFKNSAQLISFTEYLNNQANYENVKGFYIVYDTNACYAFYDDVHQEEVEDNNPCWLTDCKNCGKGSLYVGNESTHNYKYKASYTNYFANGDKLGICQNANCECGKEYEVVDTLAPIISKIKGYATSEDGKEITFGYDIDKDALAYYNELADSALELGFVVAVNAYLDGAPLNLDGTEATLAKGKVVKTVTNAVYSSVDFRLTGKWDNNVTIGDEETQLKYVELFIAGYIFDGAVNYVNNEGSSADYTTVTAVTHTNKPVEA